MIHIGSVYTSCCSSPSSHPHILTSSLHTHHHPSTLFPLPSSFLLLLSLFFSPLLCLLDNCLLCWHFHHCKTNRIGGGWNIHPCHAVTPSSSLCVGSSHIFFYSSSLRSITSSILVNKITHCLSWFSVRPVLLWQSCFGIFSRWPQQKALELQYSVNGSVVDQNKQVEFSAYS